MSRRPLPAIRRSLHSNLIRGLLALALVAAGCGPAGVTPVPVDPSLPPALAPGTYTSHGFLPAVTFTVPSGWEVADDGPAYFQLRPAGSDIVGIHLFRDPAAASQDPLCPTTPEPEIGGTSSELASWIRGLPGLVVGNPKLASVGGLRGVELDLAIIEGWTASCPFAEGLPTVPLFVGPGSEFRWVMAGTERLRLYLLDLPDGGTLVVDVDAFDGSLIDPLIAEAVPIVGSFSFAAGG